jgi:hypothetical protein
MKSKDKYWFKWTSPSPFAAIYPVTWQGWLILLIWLITMIPIIGSTLNLLKQQDLVAQFAILNRYIPISLITSVLFVYFGITKSDIRERKAH